MSLRHALRRRAAGYVLLPVVLLLAVVGASAWLANRELGLNADMASNTLDRDKARLAAEAGLQRVIVQAHSKGCGGTYPIPIIGALKDTAFDGATYAASAWPLSGSPIDVTSVGTYGGASVTLTRSNVPMHQATPVPLILQPGTAGIDTFLSTSGSGNYATQITLNAVNASAQPLLKFDLASVPAGAHIVSASLSMYAVNGSGSGNVALHRVTRDWTEAGATWASADGTAAWTTAGGDVHPSAVATAAFAGTGTWLSWDVTELADKWSKGSLPNQGVQVRVPAGISGMTLASSDHSTSSYRPKLVLSFLPPCGWTPPDTVLTLTPLADTDIEAFLLNATLNYGNLSDLWLSKDGADERPLLKFDQAGFDGKTVSSAILRVYLQSLNGPAQTGVVTTLEAHEITKVWKELEATWKVRQLATNWSSQGGDFSSTVSASLTLPANTAPGVWLEFDITALAQKWANDKTTNNGVLLLVKNLATVQFILNSRENAANPPQLVVSYH